MNTILAPPVKNYAKKNPHTMGGWSRASRSHVAHMNKGDFYGSEQSHMMPKAGSVKIEHVAADGKVTVMKEKLALLEGEIIDASFLSIRELKAFLEKEIESALKDHMLLSVHLKATMMKVSDPVIFGVAVQVFYKDLFDKYGDNVFKEIGFNPNNGLQDLYDKMKKLPEVTKSQLLADIDEVYEKRPWLAMVNSEKGITNLHVPSDVIVDASMPCVIRDRFVTYLPPRVLSSLTCLSLLFSLQMKSIDIVSLCYT